MVRDHIIAEKIIQAAQEASSTLNEALRLVMDNCSQTEFEEFRRAVSYPMGEIYLRIIAPLSKEHPGLDPLAKAEPPASISREENVPAYDPDSPLMFLRLYKLINDAGESEGVLLQVHKPTESKDFPGEWYCNWSVSSIYRRSFGVDAAQALLLALQMAEAKIESLLQGRRIEWAGGSSINLLREIKA
jgi:hypothetical protein